MLDANRLKNKIKQAFIDEQTEETDHNASVDRIAQKLAQAIVDEIKDNEHPNREGNYFIKKVVTTFGTGGARRKITIDNKL